ncbi:MAG TPA: MarR family transcriptional regulator [Thermoplasmata archaeon]|nr:MarR family transcriptional regulator [Thermoplasmata archaeon]
MVVALFTLIGSLQRATRQSKGASTLSLLQVLGAEGPMRPSELAHHQGVTPSLVTHQLRELEGRGYVRAKVNPVDERSRLIVLTRAGRREITRLRSVGIDRFTLFVNDWRPEEVRTLTLLIEKLMASKATAVAH